MEKSNKSKEKVSASKPSRGTSEIEFELVKNPTQDGCSDAQAKNGSPFTARSSSFRPSYFQANLVDIEEMCTIQQQGTDIICSMDASSRNGLVTGCVNGKATLWYQGQEIRSFQSEIHNGPIHAIALQAPDDNFNFLCVFLAHSKGPIRVWRKTAQTVNFFPVGTLQSRCDYIKNKIFPCRQSRPSNMVRCLCLSDDRIFIYTGAADGNLNTWSTLNYDYKLVDTTRCHKGPIRALAVGPGVVFSGGDRGVIIMWKRDRYGRTQDKVRHLVLGLFFALNEIEPVRINSLQLGRMSNVGGWLYAGCSDGRVRCWKMLNLANPKADKHVPEVMIQPVGETRAGEITCLALSSGLLVFSGSTDGTICVWKRETRGNESHRLAMVLPAHTSPVKCIAVQNAWMNVNVNADRPHEWALYSCSAVDGTFKIWSVGERQIEGDATGSGAATGSGEASGSGGERLG